MTAADEALERLARLLADADAKGDTFGLPGLISTQAVRECLAGRRPADGGRHAELEEFVAEVERLTVPDVPEAAGLYREGYADALADVRGLLP